MIVKTNAKYHLGQKLYRLHDNQIITYEVTAISVRIEIKMSGTSHNVIYSFIRSDGKDYLMSEDETIGVLFETPSAIVNYVKGLSKMIR